jgi:hypothetical protein
MSGSLGQVSGHDREFWVNLTTGQVEEGRLSPVTVRMGPYSTREAAERAFETAAERNRAWEDEERTWKEDVEAKDDDWP